MFYWELSGLPLPTCSSALLSGLGAGGGKTTLTFWLPGSSAGFVLPQKVVMVWTGLFLKDLGVKEIRRVKRPEARDHLLFYAVTRGHFADLGLSLLFHQKMGWIVPSQILPSPGMAFLVCREPGWVIRTHFYLSTRLYLMSFS